MHQIVSNYLHAHCLKLSSIELTDADKYILVWVLIVHKMPNFTSFKRYKYWREMFLLVKRFNLIHVFFICTK